MGLTPNVDYKPPMFSYKQEGTIMIKRTDIKYDKVSKDKNGNPLYEKIIGTHDDIPETNVYGTIDWLPEGTQDIEVMFSPLRGYSKHYLCSVYIEGEIAFRYSSSENVFKCVQECLKWIDNIYVEYNCKGVKIGDRVSSNYELLD